MPLSTAPQTTPLLTVSVPVGLQYGGNAGSIVNQSQATDSSGEVVGLQVQPSETLALLGGDVSLEGGRMQAPGGQIELGGLTGVGVVEIEGKQSEGAFRLTSLRFPDAVERADVLMTNLAYVNLAASGGGSIAINARNIDVSGESLVRGGLETNSGFLGARAGDIELSATEEINLTYGIIATNVRTGAVGNGGNINITAGSISMTNDALLQDGTDGQGDAGSINITAGSLSVTNGAELQALTYGQEDAGSITINARDTVSFDGLGGAFSTVDSEAVGNSGGINITAGSLVTNSALLVSNTYGQGDAGDITITARDTVSMGRGVGNKPSNRSSGVYSIVGAGGMGNGGDINITAGSLSVTNGNQVSASTIGQGDAGSVTINARDTVSFDRVGSDGSPSGAFSTVDSGAIGNGGSINIITGSLSVTNGGELSTSSVGSGAAGNIKSLG